MCLVQMSNQLKNAPNNFLPTYRSPFFLPIDVPVKATHYITETFSVGLPLSRSGDHGEKPHLESALGWAAPCDELAL